MNVFEAELAEPAQHIFGFFLLVIRESRYLYKFQRILQHAVIIIFQERHRFLYFDVSQ